MRVLLVHNYYGSTAPSGENMVFDAEKLMLEKHGLVVGTFTRHSDEIRLVVGDWWLVVGVRRIYNLIKGAVCTVGNPFAARALAKKIREFKPDVVHFHNTFPLISPLAIRAAHRSGAKVVMTIHNYRTICAAGVPTRNGHVCTECFNHHCPPPPSTSTLSIIPAIKNRCYRGSLLATIPLAINIFLYRKCWAKWVDRFVCLTPFARTMMISAGFPSEKLVVKGNFVRIDDQLKVKGEGRDSIVLYVGRLSEEKGVRTLIEAWNLMGESAPDLQIIGDGDCRNDYELMAENPRIHFVGRKGREFVLNALGRAKLLVIPSLCYEGLPTTLMESFMLGTPCLVSNLGALPSLVEGCGETFVAGDAKSLAATVQRFMRRSDWLALSVSARERAQDKYTEAQNFKMIQSLYKEVLS